MAIAGQWIPKDLTSFKAGEAAGIRVCFVSGWCAEHAVQASELLISGIDRTIDHHGRSGSLDVDNRAVFELLHVYLAIGPVDELRGPHGQAQELLQALPVRGELR